MTLACPLPRPSMTAGLLALLLPVATLLAADFEPPAEGVASWLSCSDRSALLEKQDMQAWENKAPAPGRAQLQVLPSIRYQDIAGFGFALTGGSAQHLRSLTPEKRRALLEELFRPVSGLGYSCLRLSIGASDLNERVFSYDDLPEGEEDFRLRHFSLSEDLLDVIPVMREILEINPRIFVFASPWSAPAWMKTNGKAKGGRLRAECRGVYAQYFVRYVKEMARQGVRIDAVTLQNEPFNDGNTPSMQMFAKEQAVFIRDHVGPAFRAAGIETRIIAYDHNCDAPEYPLSVLDEPGVGPFVDGSGFHLYAGEVGAMSRVHEAFPEKSLYFTEMMAVSIRDFEVTHPVTRIAMGALRNWSRNVVLWNLAADARFLPHTGDGGCSFCQGAVTIEKGEVTRNVAYYVIGHFSALVPPGSRRIASTEGESLRSVAFLRPDGARVLVVANPSAEATELSITENGRCLSRLLPAKSVLSLLWR